MMGKKGPIRSWRPSEAAVGATFFLLLGLGVVWFARKIADIQDGAVLASFVIVPALLYVVLRGDLAELKGPGGWGATFVRVASTGINVTGAPVTSKDVQIIEKRTINDLITRMPRLKGDQPILMTMALGTVYTVADVEGYLKTLAPFPRFRLVALVDKSGAFLGCMSPTELAGLMRSEALRQGFLDAIQDGDAQEVFRYPGTLREVMFTSETNAEALSVMTSHNLDAVAIVDNARKVLGVVEREQLVSRLILSLIPR